MVGLDKDMCNIALPESHIVLWPQHLASPSRHHKALGRMR